jgi:hypothetical protein
MTTCDNVTFNGVGCNDEPLPPITPRLRMLRLQAKIAFVAARLAAWRPPGTLAVAVPSRSGGGGTSLRQKMSGIDPVVFGGDPGGESCEVHLRGTRVRVTSMGGVTVLAEDGWTHRFVPAGWIAQVKA